MQKPIGVMYKQVGAQHAAPLLLTLALPLTLRPYP